MSGEISNLIPVQTVDDSKIGCSPDSIHKLTLIVTKGCNLSCDYCYEKHIPEQKMSVEDAIKYIDKYNPEIIKFFGGEPLSNRKLITEIMDKYPDKTYELITNGTYIQKLPVRYWMMFSSINISFDGFYTKDDLRWSNNEEYHKVLRNILWLKKQIGTESIIINIALYIDKIPKYSTLERIQDIEKVTGLTKYDVNVVQFDAEGNYIMSNESRNKFLYWSLDVVSYSVQEGGKWDVTLNEAMFAQKGKSNVCCIFSHKGQVAIDVNGFENHCHVGAYYNIPNHVLETMDKESDASCVTLEYMAREAGVELNLDSDNFETIMKMEDLNHDLYYARTKERVLCR